MKLGALALLCAVTGLHGPAAAEPCPVFVLQPKPLRADVAAAAEGGIIIGELPTPQNGRQTTTDDRAGWAVRMKGKRLPSLPATIAPGLVVYKPPGGPAWELVDARNKRIARGTFTSTSKLPELLDAPPATRITSGTTQERHPNSFVTVELSAAAPKTALALVLAKSKGPAYSWGVAAPGSKTIDVFTTGSGCFTSHSEGTVQAQPGETVTLFWIDVHGRRSRATPPLVVEKP